MTDDDFNWSQSWDGVHGGERTEAQVLLLQSQASSTLAAMATDQWLIVVAQMDDLWARSCMDKVFCMTTWVLIAKQAATTAGVALTLVLGDENGKPKSDLTEEEQVSESFMNLLLGANSENSAPMEQAFDAMHDYLHEASERSGRAVFMGVLGATAAATNECMKIAVSKEQ